MGGGVSRVGRRRRHRGAGGVAAAVLAAAGGLALVACGGGSGNTSGGSTSFSPRPSPPVTASFSGTPPSALASAASSAVASARASASAASSSASARASEFEASVSAETERANAAARKKLEKAQGRGNAVSDVSLTGMPRSETEGLLALHVNIRNATAGKASFAVQVDFRDSGGKVVETRYVGATGVRPGETVHPIVISHEPPEPKLNAVVAKAQRY
ncbi:hypothetical protein [Streptomyces broussonetiae]|uniref:DUF3426 domain-containing protein n=1 Tax=Streptomyces broussonetiae TaxID=2686304 RepID=A0A6I6N3R4_9ACTN|nr:hypothetical protein [Streptomyces broussonetiae]QHA05299.1 hypothetical protein GQF42_20165 [Streptomyces broussonetiae]